jgi:hypothetical protein
MEIIDEVLFVIILKEENVITFWTKAKIISKKFYPVFTECDV